MKRVLFMLILILLLPLPVKKCLAVDTRELAIKAAYLFRLSLFVDWPAEKISPSGSGNIRFCIAGGKEIAETIKNVLSGKTISRHEIETVGVDPKAELKDCHLLYVTKNTKAEDLFLQAVVNYPVLTVGETERFYRQGGMVLLFEKENRIFFAINRQAADRARIKFGAQLLNLAEQYP
ncbi:YfiR family protein [Methylosarcina fibrata]|uniref:YfiR family protein n=1 Tax=Methylosarcina fibrata TaxID=105972 RepID=UPI0003A04DBA|nr:YfiR family protein [Methylosarcina fibrata]